MRGMIAMGRITVIEDRCKGCGLCAEFCPKKIIEISKYKINQKGYHLATLIDETKCIGCASCATMCPDVAIVVER